MGDRLGAFGKITPSSSRSRYRITGKIRDRNNRAVKGYRVGAFDEDLGSRLNPDDLLGVAKTDGNGDFEISFSKDAFEDWFETDPDVYLVVKDRAGKALIRTPTKKNTTRLMEFQIKLDGSEVGPQGHDPYSDSLLSMIGALRDAGDAADLSKADVRTIFELLMRVIASWTVNRDELVRLRGYDGIQVPKNPREEKHDHVTRWDKPILRV
ncbi:MAG TPA: hypothetical protein PLM24_00305 [Methanothrix sp.]|nr:hypothetical protein [Methanothrix sp.]HPJ83321.1 hypothetical protein [Methanothrix sp.]HPR65558.1 hypothetical protein [Methanothrix sp.]